MKHYFGYVRVSDPRQGRGVSLDEQKAAIQAHAVRQGFEVSEWFRELETAAAKGRNIFSRMLVRLERGEADGVVIHKIDRSARNLEDWSNLGRLVDRGIDIQFAHDNVDLRTRGGRLSADIIAVVAADYIRNLRDEVKKGFYGRLKQGVYPLPAPIGYLNKGAGQPKEIDPHSGPLVRRMFERYATGTISLRDLRDAMSKEGLRSRRGGELSISGTAKLLRNPFYLGLMRIEKTNETFEGAHEHLVTKSLFDRVQAVLDGKAVSKVQTHDFPFKRMIRCARCARALTGERQKTQYVYYRCHSGRCKDTIIRGSDADQCAARIVAALRLAPDEMRDLRDLVDLEASRNTAAIEGRTTSLALRLQQCDSRLSRLTDAFLDGVIDQEEHDTRKTKLQKEKTGLKHELASIGDQTRLQELHKMFELGEGKILRHESANPLEKRELLETLCSNWVADGKNLVIRLNSPYREMLEEPDPAYCGPFRDRLRTRAERALAGLKAIELREIQEGLVPVSREKERKPNKGWNNIKKYNAKRHKAHLKRLGLGDWPTGASPPKSVKFAIHIVGMRSRS